MTHAESLVWAAAFVDEYQRARARARSNDESAEDAVVRAWAIVAALREVKGHERTCSIEMLAEFRSATKGTNDDG